MSAFRLRRSLALQSSEHHTTSPVRSRLLSYELSVRFRTDDYEIGLVRGQKVLKDFLQGWSASLMRTVKSIELSL